MKRRASSLGISVAVMLLVVGCGPAGPGGAIGPAPDQAAGAVAAISAAQPPTSGGVSQGLQIHGHWVIDVRNPDGSLASHTEFDNALWGGQGDIALANFLGRARSVGLWDVTVDNAGSSTYSYVQVREPQELGNLTVTVPAAAPSSVVLQGSGTSVSTFTATRVVTAVGQCAVTPPPATLCGIPYQGFTIHFLAPGVSITAGQTVVMTVTFTFS